MRACSVYIFVIVLVGGGGGGWCLCLAISREYIDSYRGRHRTQKYIGFVREKIVFFSDGGKFPVIHPDGSAANNFGKILCKHID